MASLYEPCEGLRHLIENGCIAIDLYSTFSTTCEKVLTCVNRSKNVWPGGDVRRIWCFSTSITILSATPRDLGYALPLLENFEDSYFD